MNEWNVILKIIINLLDKIMIMNGVFLLMLSLPLCFCDNFQQRIVYYTEDENVCRTGNWADQINLMITSDRFEKFTTTFDGSTCCFGWAPRYYADIDVFQTMGFYQSRGLKQRIQFSQTTTWITDTFSGNPIKLVVKATVINPVTFNGVSMDCVILGDAKQHHYGIDFPRQPPATISMYCGRPKQNLQKNIEETHLMESDAIFRMI